MFATIITFVIVLGVLVLVHELGHFITARRSGMLVEEFGIGFPPRLFSFKKGETRYSINLIPFGGFVKILGEDGAEPNNPRSFASKPAWKRAIVLAAGVIMNFVLAAVLLSIVNGAGTTTVIENADQYGDQAHISNIGVTVTEVDADSPAESAGVHLGDTVIGVNGQSYESRSDIAAAISENAGKEITIDVKRGQESLALTATPRADPPAGRGALGIGLAQTATVSYPWYLAIWEGIKQTGTATAVIFIVLGDVLKSLFTTGTVGPEVAGPIGIAVLTGQARELGIVPLLQFAAILSVNLGIINAIPIPALDGGRLLFLLIERVRRKKISKRVENIVHSVGFGLLLLMLAAISWRDVVRFSVIERIKDLF